MPSLYLLIGGNQGDRKALLQQSTDLIQQRIGSVVAVSRLYETEPWGDFGEQTPGTGRFLNAALLVDTPLLPHESLLQALEIERLLGRQRPILSSAPADDSREERHTSPNNTCHRIYSSRPIDIDVIFYDNKIIDTPDLVIPHPRMHLRRFVLQPLCDIAPDYIHPILNKSLEQLLSECPDNCSCYCYC